MSTETSTSTKPKKPLSGFFLYKRERYPEIKKKNPELAVVEITKMVSKMWNNLSETEKEKFTGLAKSSREKYEIDK